MAQLTFGSVKKILGAAVIAAGVGQLAIGSAQAETTTQTVTRYAVTPTNIRSGPSTSYKLVDTVQTGVEIDGVMLPSGWIKITAPSENAGEYVSGSVLSTVGPERGGIVGNTITGWVASFDHDVNIRSGPGLQYGIVGIAARSTIVHGSVHASKVSGTVSGDWIKVSNGYLNGALIETTSSYVEATNGYVLTSSMCAVPLAFNTTENVSPNYTKNTTRYLNCQAEKSLNDMEAAYKQSFGHYALIDLTYRSHAEEVYWKKARPDAASPIGQSNHGWGLAIDFHEVDDAYGNEIKSGEFYWGQPGYKWLAANASKYGFAGDPVHYGKADESYHWNFVG